MELCTERLILKEMTWDDVDIIHRLHSFEEVEKYNTIGLPRHIGDTLEVMLSALEDQQLSVRSHFGWLIRLADSDEFVGEAGMHLSDDRFRKAEIYYSILPEHWQKGYATEVVRCLINFGFITLKLHRIQAGVDTENHRSIRVLEKAGMVREGLQRRNLPIHNSWKDSYLYAIVEDDPYTI
jgi:[ribosomal protein S5]-alanine N-acetyltransferase